MAKFNQEFYAPQNYEANVKRAWHNLSTKLSFTPQTGLNDIAYCRRLYKGDDFKINTATLLQTLNPLVKPLLDCFELRLEYYFEPLSNLYGYMDNNSKESTEDIVHNSPKWTAVLFGRDFNGNRRGIISPGVVYSDGSSVDYSSYPISPNDSPSGRPMIYKNSLLEAIGVPARWQGVSHSIDDEVVSYGWYRWYGNEINIEPLLVYLDIMRTYHINQQFNKVLFSKGWTDAIRTNLDGYLVNFDWTDVFGTDLWNNPRELDDLFVELRYASRHRDASLQFGIEDTTSSVPWRRALANYIYWSAREYGGFFPCQYKPDLWRNILNESVGSVKSFVSVVDGQVSIDEFRQKNKLQRWIDAIDLSGGRYKNLLRTVFGGDAPRQLDIPQLLAVSKHLIDPSNITALAESTEVNLGQMGAKIDKFNKSREVRVRADQDGYLMVICNITPLVTYSQGINYNLLKFKMHDDYNPNFQRLGFQNVAKALYSPLPDILDYSPVESGDSTDYVPIGANGDTSVSVGKQIAWINDISDVNHSRGEFNGSDGLYRDMVLNRRYTMSWLENSVSGNPLYYQRFELNPYVNPFENRDIFTLDPAQYGNYSSPWSLHIAFNIQAKRPIGKRYRPNLE